MKDFIFELFRISMLCGVGIVFIGLLSPLFKKKHTVYWRYLLWVALGVRLLLPFDITIESPVVTIPVLPKQTVDFYEFQRMTEYTGNISLEAASDRETRASEKKLDLIEDSYVEPSEANKPTEKVKPVPYGNYLFILWIAVCILLTVFQISIYISFCLKIKKTGQYLFSTKGINVYSFSQISSPLMTGFFCPKIILPKTSYEPEQMEFILQHELTHYKRKDLWVKLLLTAARTIHWFNPLVYYMEKRAGEDMELLCDSQVVAGFSREEKKQYSEMLLSAASQKNKQRALLCSSDFSKNTKTLRERFSNIFSSNTRKKGFLIAFLGIGILAFGSIFVAFGTTGDKNNSFVSDSPDSAKTQEPVKAVEIKGTGYQKIPELSIEEAANAIYGAVFPQLIFASSQRAVVYDYWGLLIYDVKNQEIEQLLDLPAVGLCNIQGDKVTHIEVSNDGKQLLLYNEPDTQKRYVYYIDEKRLEYSDLDKFKENHYEGLTFIGEKETALTEDGRTAYLTLDSLVTEAGEPFHEGDMQGLSLVISDRSLGTGKIYPLFREYYSGQKDGSGIFSALKWQDIKRRVVKEEYLYQDSDGWAYYLLEDAERESRIQEFAAALEPLLLVRKKGGKQELLDDLLTQDMWAECPVLFAKDRIIYKAAKAPDVIGVKDPVLVSIALDGSDRKTADTILYHVFDGLCEDNGWIYYTGWTQDGSFPKPLCRISADFSSGSQLVDELPGLLCGVMDGYVFYLADEERKDGIWRRNLSTGEEQIHDKWGFSAESVTYFNCREQWFAPGTLRTDGIEGCISQFSRSFLDEEAYSYAVPFYTP